MALAHRWRSLAIGLGLTVGSLFLAAQPPAGLNPREDNGIVQLTIEGPPGQPCRTCAAGARC